MRTHKSLEQLERKKAEMEKALCEIKRSLRESREKALLATVCRHAEADFAASGELIGELKEILCTDYQPGKEKPARPTRKKPEEPIG
jgi:hypothetical protein